MKRALSLLLICTGIILNFRANAQDSSICYLRDPGGHIREHNVDYTHMILDVKFDTKESRVSGNVKYDFKPIQYHVDTMFLDAPGINIKKVMLDGKGVPFTTDSAGLILRFSQPLDWNKKYKLEIAYDCTPRKGLYFIGWNVDDNNPEHDLYYTRRQIWTQGQGTDNRYWFPSYDDVDDKLITETIITFDTAYTVISNGLLKDKKKNNDGTYTWHYAMSKPMETYLVMIGIDKYAYKDYPSKCGIVSREYYYSDRPQTVAPTYIYSGEMMDFLSQETGFAYPWECYANVPVQDFMYGAMENTTATVYGDFYLCDARPNIERGYTSVNAHELTHQRFGDCITEYSATNHWLHESFATYYAKQFLRHQFGADMYAWVKRAESNSAIAADRIDRYPVAHSKGGNARHYPKGSFVIDMMRYVVGDSVFKKTITHYLNKHAFENVDTHDFMMSFMESAGVNLDWFFDEWVTRAGFPQFEVSYANEGNKVAFFVRQTQRVDELTGYFKMPVIFEVHFKDGTSRSTTAWLAHAADTVYVDAVMGKEIDYTLFDPNSNIIKTLSFKRTYDELAAQAEKAVNALDRFDALIALRDSAIDKKRDMLVRMYKRGNYPALQNEIVLQLSKDHQSASEAIMLQAIHDKDYSTRRAVLEDLEDFSPALLPEVEKLLEDSSYVTIELALRKLCKLYPAKALTYLDKVKDVKGVNDNVRICWLEMKSKGPFIDSLNALKYKQQLVVYASNRYEFRTRAKAMDAVERLGYCDNDLISNLFNASLYTNTRLSGPAQKVLKTLLKTPANLTAAKEVYAKNKWQDWERKILDELLKG